MPAGVVLGMALHRLARHWDELAGAVRRASAPVSSLKVARIGCLQLVTVDLAVRFTALLWLTRSQLEPPEPPPTPWAEKEGMRTWLRSLHARTGLSRDELASAAHVDEHTLDAWLDDEVRPTHENLQDLVLALADHGADDAEVLLRDLRRAYGLRHLLSRVADIVGGAQANEIAVRLVGYGAWMLGLPLVPRHQCDAAGEGF